MKCHLTKDLLPSYIDGLVSENTKSDIEEHLYECEDCNELAEKLKIPIVVNPANKELKEVNYFKKIKKQSKRLKTATISLTLLIFIAVGLFISFGIGTKVSADEIMIQTKFQKTSINGNTEVYLEQEWIIDFELISSEKALRAKTTDVFTEAEDGSKQLSGYIIDLYQVPATKFLHEDSGFTMGYTYAGDKIPTHDFTYTIRLKDKTIAYSMKEEGLFEKQIELHEK